MSRSLITCTLFIAGLAAAAQAANPPAQSPISSKQLSQCMMKRMMANRAVSYNEAARLCREERGERKLEASVSESPKHLGGS